MRIFVENHYLVAENSSLLFPPPPPTITTKTTLASVAPTQYHHQPTNQHENSVGFYTKSLKSKNRKKPKKLKKNSTRFRRGKVTPRSSHAQLVKRLRSPPETRNARSAWPHHRGLPPEYPASWLCGLVTAIIRGGAGWSAQFHRGKWKTTTKMMMMMIMRHTEFIYGVGSWQIHKIIIHIRTG